MTDIVKFLGRKIRAIGATTSETLDNYTEKLYAYKDNTNERSKNYVGKRNGYSPCERFCKTDGLRRRIV